MNIITVPISTADEYFLCSLTRDRHLRSINRNIRSIDIPVGNFHIGLHEQVTEDLDPDNKAEVSYYANHYKYKIDKINSRVIRLFKCPEDSRIKVEVDWDEDVEEPSELRVTAVMNERRCIRLMQFGYEL